jgi:hypothetical protein
LKKNRVPGQQIHHLIEQRLWKQSPALKKLFPNVDDMPGVSLTPAQHQVFTNFWRKLMPYKNQAGHVAKPTVGLIMENAAQVYAAHPEYFQAILLAFIFDHMAVM